MIILLAKFTIIINCLNFIKYGTIIKLFKNRVELLLIFLFIALSLLKR